ncbi:ATPase, class VI, type 11A (predicted), isoform CRA_e, partial [Rattus norvegicus]
MEQHVGIDVLKRDPSLYRDIAKNALLRWRLFIYWTFLGVFDALVFFFGAYFMFENTTVTINGQIMTTNTSMVRHCGFVLSVFLECITNKIFL